MSDLSISKKTIGNILTERGSKFLIPEYQRPYSWGRDECETLWEDLYNFAFPEDNDFDDDNDEYFLGTIVTVKNEYKENEVIDGQQRLMTIFLLFRAYYESFYDKNEDNAKEIAKCLWGKKNERINCKIKSDVATDADTQEFNKIIETGEATKGNKSKYAENYRYFQRKISELKIDEFANFSTRILDNCIILPIETTLQSTAFRIFTTLNDRGMPLSDSDIFKSQFYKFFKGQGKDAKENFVRRWKELENTCNEIFNPRRGTPTDDLFNNYMYYLLAKSKINTTTFKGIGPYYAKNNYEKLKSNETFEDLITLLRFWNDVTLRNSERFSQRVLKRLYILEYSPHSIWKNIVSIYFMGNRNQENLLDDEKFYKFLHKITAMILMHSVMNLGTLNIRHPFFLEFQNILYGKELSFKNFKQTKPVIMNQLYNIKFSNTKLITRAMLAWWIFQNENQELPPLDTKLEIEHIYAKKRAEFNPLKNEESLELLGNKTLLEKRINIRAADYRFADKKKYYLGQNGKKNETPTFNLELLNLANNQYDFIEKDIISRNEKIFEGFINYLEENNLLK